MALISVGQFTAAGVSLNERSMALICLAGWPGAILGQVVFRHKLRKPGYMLVFMWIVELHVALWVTWYRLTR